MDDSCCAGVLARLQARGLPARLITTPLKPPAKIAWSLDPNGVVSSLYQGVADTAIAGVLIRDVGLLDPEGWSATDHAYMQAELQAVILAWLSGLACPVVNRPDAALWYRGGTSPLAWSKLLRSSGLAMPEVVITTEPAVATAFCRQLAADRVGGAVYAPVTGSAGYLLADDEAWNGLAALQSRAPVCLMEPHGEPMLACIVGDDVVWGGPISIEAEALEPALLRFAAAAHLTFVEIAIAPVRAGPAVVLVNPHPRVERFAPAPRERILDALCSQLLSTPVSARGATMVLT